MDLTQVPRTSKANVYATPAVEVRRDGSVERRRVYIAAQLVTRLNTSTFARWYCFED